MSQGSKLDEMVDSFNKGNKPQNEQTLKPKMQEIVAELKRYMQRRLTHNARAAVMEREPCARQS
jgi:hypothetical protein